MGILLAAPMEAAALYSEHRLLSDHVPETRKVLWGSMNMFCGMYRERDTMQVTKCTTGFEFHVWLEHLLLSQSLKKL
jgi:hypothetical protein